MSQLADQACAKRVLVAMSGGVDSSVAAALLLEQGHDVIGVTMQLWDYSQNEQQHCDPSKRFDTCCSHDDVQDARAVAARLGIPFYVLDYEDDFRTNVVDYFTEEYLRGRTPNPCVACNTFLKFDRLIERAESLGCDAVATGHYARITQSADGTYQLRRGRDPLKDQSYFLYSMTQERLSKTMFPLGDLTKPEVRAHAERLGLPTATKKESMEICFVPGNDYAAFIKRQVSDDRIIRGAILHEDGTTLAQHDGIHQFTVGQRKGLGMAAGEPLYVTKIDPSSGTVVVGPKESLIKRGFVLDRLHFVRPGASLSESYRARIRYRSRDAVGRFEQTQCLAGKQQDPGSMSFLFSEPQSAVTPGQIAVFYQDDEVVAGGFIGEVLEQ
jgi:tRNA-specific 2-thiouridylase